MFIVDTEELRSFRCLQKVTRAFITGLLGLMATLNQKDALRKMHFWSSIISVYWGKKKGWTVFTEPHSTWNFVGARNANLPLFIVCGLGSLSNHISILARLSQYYILWCNYFCTQLSWNEMLQFQDVKIRRDNARNTVCCL